MNGAPAFSAWPSGSLLIPVNVLRWTLPDALGDLRVLPAPGLLLDVYHVDLVPPVHRTVRPGHLFIAQASRKKVRLGRTLRAAGARDWQVTNQHRQQRRRGVWQPRYWEHRIRDEKDFMRYRDDIHLNPVKHGHVENPGDWPWSSFRRHVRMGWLDPNWPGSSPADLPDIND